MSVDNLSKAFEHLRQTLPLPNEEALADSELLTRFINRRDQTAFAALFRRHSPMVLMVCRRVLGHIHDAEDALQATFLLLARKAKRVMKRQALGSFLYKVAYRTALEAKRLNEKHKKRERLMASLPPVETPAQEIQDWHPVLYRELNGLPEKYRELIVLCDLEGQARKHVANQLKLSEGTVSSRLARGRDMLAQRLSRRGVMLSTGALATALMQEAASAPLIPASLVASTTAAATSVATGKAATLTIPAVILMKGVMQAIFLTKLKVAASIFLVASIVGGGGFAYRLQYLQADPTQNKRFGSELESLWKEIQLLQPVRVANTDGEPDAAATGPDGRKTDLPPYTVRFDQDGAALPPGALARLGSALRFRHEEGVGGLAYTPDGKTLAAAGHKGTSTILMDAITGKEVRRLKGGHVVAISPDGKALACMGEDAVSVWDIASGKLLWQRKTHTKKYLDLSRLIYSPNGKNLAVMETRDVYLLDAASGSLRWQHSEPFHSATVLGYAPDGKSLVCAWRGARGALAKVQMWDLPSGNQRWRHITPRGYITALAYAPDSRFLVLSGSVGNRLGVWLWDTATGIETRQILHSKTWLSLPAQVAFSPNGKTIACQGEDLKLWEMSSGKLLWQKDFRPLYVNNSRMAFAPDGRTMAIGNAYEEIVHLVDTASGEEVSLQGLGHETEIQTLAYARDSQSVLTAASDGTVRQWEVASGRQLTQSRISDESARTYKPPMRAAIAPNNCTIVKCNRPRRNLGNVELWDAVTGKQLWHKEYSCWRLAYAPDGKTVAAIIMNESQFRKRKWAVKLLEVSSGKQLWETPLGTEVLPILDDSYPLVTFTGDSKALAVSIPESKSPIYILDTKTGKVLRRLGSTPGFCEIREKLIGTSHERIIVEIVLRILLYDRYARWQSLAVLWDITTGQKIGQMNLPKNDHIGVQDQATLALSPDGWTLAYGDSESIRFWDIAAGCESGRFQFCSNVGSKVALLAYAPNGRSLVSTGGCAPGTALIWDLARHHPQVAPGTRELNARQLADLWRELAGTDAGRAEQALWSLADAPRQTVPFLRRKLRIVTPPDPERLRQLISGLDADAFSERNRAAREIKNLGGPAIPALREVLAAKPSLEVRRRLEVILTELENQLPIRSLEELRKLRAVRALERAGTSEARQFLKELASGAPEALQTREAAAAFRRLAACDEP